MKSYIVFFLCYLLVGVENGLIYNKEFDHRQDFFNNRDFESVPNPRGIDHYRKFEESRDFVNYPRHFDDQDIANMGSMDAYIMKKRGILY